MEEVVNQYQLLEPFQNENAGFSKWTYAKKNEKEYFLKEFLNPIYPMGDSISAQLQEQRVKECEEYEKEKVNLYKTINEISDGNLVRISEFFRYDSHYYISTEKVISENISFEELQKISFDDRLLLCKALAHAMRELHKAGIVHADIKDSNVLLKKTTGNKIIGKIIDFDCSFFESNPPRFEDELGGDQVYLAPEACQFMCGEDVQLTCKIDVFALGLLFHQYLTGKLPEFEKEEYDYAFDAVLDDQILGISAELPAELQTLIGGMLEKDMEKRLSMDAVYEAFEKMEQGSDPETENSKEPENTAPKKADGEWFFSAGDL